MTKNHYIMISENLGVINEVYRFFAIKICCVKKGTATLKASASQMQVLIKSCNMPKNLIKIDRKIRKL